MIDETIENEIVITVIATGFTKSSFDTLKLDNIVGEALKNATNNSNISQSNTSTTLADLGLSSPSLSKTTISSTSNQNNNEYKMVDLDIPPFLRRNKGE